MTLYILDTDHLSLQQRGHQQMLSRFNQIPPYEIAITVITVEEQFRGRLAQIRGARSDSDLIQAYRQLRETTCWLTRYLILDFDDQAKQNYDLLRQQKIRVSTQDLRIAAVVLAKGGTLVTRNQKDFGPINGLRLEDWTV